MCHPDVDPGLPIFRLIEDEFAGIIGDRCGKVLCHEDSLLLKPNPAPWLDFVARFAMRQSLDSVEAGGGQRDALGAPLFARKAVFIANRGLTRNFVLAGTATPIDPR